MLHIHNGDSTAKTLAQSSIGGRQFAFRESLISGPAPREINDAEWRRLRAGHLSSAYGVNQAECEQELRQQELVLSNYAEHDEIVLWFEHDLFCQLHLIYLLDWFNGRDLGDTKLNLICISEFPGVADFRGLGQLNTDQLVALFPLRHEVTAAELQLASAAWQAFRSPQPTAIEQLLSGDTAALPFLNVALRAHLARFPSTRNGLGRIENRALELIAAGRGAFPDLFFQFGKTEAIYGLGDSQFWLSLKRMAQAPKPLLVVTGGLTPDGAFDAEQLRETTFALTNEGQAALSGALDFAAVNGIDKWLGGVHLTDDQLWRWDEGNNRLVPQF